MRSGIAIRAVCISAVTAMALVLVMHWLFVPLQTIFAGSIYFAPVYLAAYYLLLVGGFILSVFSTA